MLGCRATRLVPLRSIEGRLPKLSKRPSELFLLFLLAAPYSAAAADDLYRSINQLRAGSGSCAAAQDLIPLAPQAALDRAARDLARGDKAEPSLKAAGYRAARYSVLSLKGDGVGAQAAQLLAKPAYCAQLQDAAMSEVGIYLDARELWVVMAAPFAPSVGMSAQAAGERVLALVNHARASSRRCGGRAYQAVRPVRWNELLAEASRAHAEDMARNNYFGHSGRDGSNPAQRVERAGYRYRSTGENIAAGQMQPEDAVAGWIRSPTHCANLMSPTYTEMGAAFAVDSASDMGVYWAQVFGMPR